MSVWRNRPLCEIRYLIVDVRFEKAWENDEVRNVAALTAIGIGPDEHSIVEEVHQASTLHLRLLVLPSI